MRTFSKKHILYLLFAYLVFQFVWWEILLVYLNHQNFEKEKQLAALKSTSPAQFQQVEHKISHQQKMKIIMVVSEGTVFLILILFGFYKVLKAYEQEILIHEQQTHFLLSLPHEIKTPLSVLQLNLQTLHRHSQLTKEQTQAVIQASLEELKRLQILTENLLLASKIAKHRSVNAPYQKYRLHIQDINLSALLKNIIQTYYPQKFIHQNITEDRFIKGDEPLVMLMVQNLIDNAVKFSNQYIQVNLYANKQKTILEVINDGELINKEEQKKIFELFYRRPSDEERGIKGTGLGLYLVKQIADMHLFSVHVYVQNNHNVFQVVF